MAAIASLSRRLSGRISHEAVEETARRKGELVVAGRYSSSRQLATDFALENDVLGAGATGKVHLATRKGGGRCAVKSVEKRKLSKSARELLMNEAGLYLSLDHPHIAKLEQVYESRKEIHFVMEHLSGGELLQRLKKNGRFTEAQAAEAMRQMLLAVSYLHAHQVAHRDLKPENFVYESADSDHLKMIDFGFASRYDTGSRLSQPCGSLHYVAPEVLTKSYTEKADLWSMGVIAYTLLCGRSPWHPYKDSRKETLKKVSAGEVYYCPERFGRLSPGAQSFIRNLLTVDPVARLSAAEALQHVWLESTARQSAQIDAAGNASNFRSMTATEPLRKICLSMAAWQMTSKETEEARDQFHALNSSKSGALTLDDFRSAITTGDSEDADEVDAEKLFEIADLDNDGEIGFNSFVVATMQQRPSLEALQAVFNRLDSDKNGKVTARDIRAVVGPTFEGYSCQELVDEADRSGAGHFTWDDFVAYMHQGDVFKSEVTGREREEGDDFVSGGCFLKARLDSARAKFRRILCRRVSVAEAQAKMPLRAATV
jgi:calcium-dependent protein kinase